MKLKFFVFKWIVKIFGDLQFFKFPLWLILWGETHYKIKGPESRAILDSIKVGDIVLRRHDRYVSTWFIPGFYTHVGIVSSDKTVVHAMTEGVVEEDILSYLRSDHLCVIRPLGLSEEERAMAVSLAKGCIGVPYDFAFDSTCDEKIYCSELIKKCYPRSFLSLAGKKQIPPDDLLGGFVGKVYESSEFRKKK